MSRRIGIAVSILYTTHRAVPAFSWFADGLARQVGVDADDVELVVVDGAPGVGRAERFAAAVGGRFRFRHLPAKPTPFNGPYRRTRRPLHAASSARNTGIVVASSPYVVFADDCAVPMPGWWDEVREAARHRYVVAGAYQKHWEMVVRDGALESSRSDPSGIDVRWDLGDEHRVVPVAGAHVFGASLGVPRDLLLDLNGFDELCDGIGGEDYQLGLRLELTGTPIFYSRRMLTIESEELHRVGSPLWRVDPTLVEDRYRERLAQFGVTRRSTDGSCDASHMVLDVLHGLRRPEALGNHYRLADLSFESLHATVGDMPETFWFDGRPLGEL